MNICDKASLVLLALALYFFCVNIWFLIRFTKAYKEMRLALDNFKSLAEKE